MKRILILTAVLVFIAGLSGSALAQPGQGCSPGKMGGHGRFGHDGFDRGCNILSCQKQLELTDDQMAKIKEINFAHQNVMIDLKADLEKAQLKMRQTQMADEATKAGVLAVAKEINAIKGKMAEARISHRFDLKAVLNADQLKKWKECKAQCQGKCGPGMGMGMGQGPAGAPGAPMDPANCPRHGDMKRDGSCMQGK